MKPETIYIALFFIWSSALSVLCISYEKKSITFTSENEKAFAQTNVTQHNQEITVEHFCRCKKGGCYAGNAISLRPSCGNPPCHENTCN